MGSGVGVGRMGTFGGEGNEQNGKWQGQWKGVSGWVAGVWGTLFPFFCPCPAAMWNLPQPGMETMPPAVEAQSLNHWTTKEVPLFFSRMMPKGGTTSYTVSPGSCGPRWPALRIRPGQVIVPCPLPVCVSSGLWTARFCAVGNKESQGQGLFWNILLIYYLKKNFFFNFYLLLYQKWESNFKSHGPHKWGYWVWLLLSSASWKKKKNNIRTKKEDSSLKGTAGWLGLY